LRFEEKICSIGFIGKGCPLVNQIADHGPGLLREWRGFSFAMPVAVHDGGAGGSAMDAPHCLKTGAFRQRDITTETPL
jgi:hypothetical protein